MRLAWCLLGLRSLRRAPERSLSSLEARPGPRSSDRPKRSCHLQAQVGRRVPRRVLRRRGAPRRGARARHLPRCTASRAARRGLRRRGGRAHVGRGARGGARARGLAGRGARRQWRRRQWRRPARGGAPRAALLPARDRDRRRRGDGAHAALRQGQEAAGARTAGATSPLLARSHRSAPPSSCCSAPTPCLPPYPPC